VTSALYAVLAVIALFKGLARNGKGIAPVTEEWNRLHARLFRQVCDAIGWRRCVRRGAPQALGDDRRRPCSPRTAFALQAGRTPR
jgi:hypothetical protein